MDTKNSETTRAKTAKQIRESTKLTTSKLAVTLGLKTNELNKIFVAMGYLEKKGKNFTLTKQGKAMGGVMKSNGTRAYILWDENTTIS
ncbi:hypothetical protein [Sulfurospirillum sp. 1612]|uniref:hypothetical protein n=1 Tax=Sulfurospirillum sp. 1612 TaxID=3094835 RepID=UPI002F931082